MWNSSQFMVLFCANLFVLMGGLGYYILKDDPKQGPKQIALTKETAHFLETSSFIKDNFPLNQEQSLKQPMSKNRAPASAPIEGQHNNDSLVAEQEYLADRQTFESFFDDQMQEIRKHPSAEKIDHLNSQMAPIFSKMSSMSESDREQVLQWQNQLQLLLEDYLQAHGDEIAE